MFKKHQYKTLIISLLFLEVLTLKAAYIPGTQVNVVAKKPVVHPQLSLATPAPIITPEPTTKPVTTTKPAAIPAATPAATPAAIPAATQVATPVATPAATPVAATPVAATPVAATPPAAATVVTPAVTPTDLAAADAAGYQRGLKDNLNGLAAQVANLITAATTPRQSKKPVKFSGNDSSKNASYGNTSSVSGSGINNSTSITN